MFFVMPKTDDKVLFLDLVNGEKAYINVLTKNLNELPREVVESHDFFDYLDTTKTVSSIKLEQYLDYENLDPYELYIYGLTKEFVKYTIEEATKEAEEIKRKQQEDEDGFEIRMYQKPLHEIAFVICKDYGRSIFNEIKEHNDECAKRGFKTYTLDDYEYLLVKYGFKDQYSIKHN